MMPLKAQNFNLHDCAFKGTDPVYLYDTGTEAPTLYLHESDFYFLGAEILIDSSKGGSIFGEVHGHWSSCFRRTSAGILGLAGCLQHYVSLIHHFSRLVTEKVNRAFHMKYRKCIAQ